MTRLVSLVERGWSGARTCALEIGDGAGVTVTHLIRGRLDAQTRAIIAPSSYQRLVDAPKRWYMVWVVVLLLREAATGRLRWVLIDHERRLARLRRLIAWLRAVPVLVSGEGDGYTLAVDGVQRPLDELLRETRP